MFISVDDVALPKDLDTRIDARRGIGLALSESKKIGVLMAVTADSGENVVNVKA